MITINTLNRSLGKSKSENYFSKMWNGVAKGVKKAYNSSMTYWNENFENPRYIAAQTTRDEVLIQEATKLQTKREITKKDFLSSCDNYLKEKGYGFFERREWRNHLSTTFSSSLERYLNGEKIAFSGSEGTAQMQEYLQKA